MAKDGGIFVWEWLADAKPLVPVSPMMDEGDSGHSDEDDSEKPRAYSDDERESEDSESDGSSSEEAGKEGGERSSNICRAVSRQAR